jgi:hypothetical protein
MEAHTIPIAATPVLRELAPAVGTGVEGIDVGVEGIGAGAVGVATGGAVGTYTGQLLHQVFSVSGLTTGGTGTTGATDVDPGA